MCVSNPSSKFHLRLLVSKWFEINVQKITCRKRDKKNRLKNIMYILYIFFFVLYCSIFHFFRHFLMKSAWKSEKLNTGLSKSSNIPAFWNESIQKVVFKTTFMSKSGFQNHFWNSVEKKWFWKPLFEKVQKKWLRKSIFGSIR